MTRHTLRLGWLMTAAITAAVGTATPCLGQNLLSWNTTGISGTVSGALASTGTAANMVGSSLNRGEGLSAASLNNGYSSTGWNGPSTLGDAIDDRNYLEFSAQPAAGYAFTADEIFINFRRTSGGPASIQFVYSVDNFTTTGTIGTVISATDSGSGGDYTISLAGLDLLQSATSTVTFRLVGWDASGSTGSGAIGTKTGDNLVLKGSVGTYGSFWNGGTWISTGPGSGGSGTWANGAANWISSLTPNFGGTAGTVTVGNATAAAGIEFTTTGYTLSSGTVTLSGANAAANTITADNGIAATINSVLIGSGGFTKAGAGSLTLGGANSVTGGIVVSAGSLIGSTANLAGDISNNGAVTFNQGSAGTYAGVLSGTGSLTKLGAGALTLSGNSTGYTGTTTVSAGLLSVTGALASSPITVSSGGSLGGSGTVGSVTIGSGGRIAPGTSPGTLTVDSLTWEGGGFYDWELYDANGPAGTGYDTISSSGALTIDATSGNPFTIRLLTLSGTNPDTPGNALNFNTAVSSTFTLGTFGSISGFSADKFSFDRTGFTNTTGGSFSVITTGVTDNILSLVYTPPVITAYDYTGGTGDWNTAGNWLNATGPSGSGTAAIIFSGAGGGTATNDLASGDFSTAKGFEFASGAGSYTVAGNALTIGIEGLGILNESSNTQTVSLDLALANPLTINAASGNITISGAIATAGNTLTVNGAQNVSLAAVSGTGSLVKLGAGQTTLTGAVGAANVTVSGGTLLLGGANQLADSAAVTVNGGTLNVQSNSDTVGSLTLTSGSVAGAGGTLTATNYTLSGGGVGANLGGGTLSVAGNATLAGTAGVTTVNLDGGTLTLGTGGRFTAAPVVTGSSNAALALAGNEAIGSLAGAANITLGSGTLTIGSADTSTTYSGTISGEGGLVKVGNGSLTLSGTTTATGGLTISAGELIGTTASLVGNIANSGTLTFTQEGNGAYEGTLSGAGGLTKSGAGAVTLSGNNSEFSGATTISAGSLVVGNANALGSGAITLAGGTLTADGSPRTLANAVTINANVGLAAASSGTLTLSGAVNLGNGTRTLTVGSGATTVLTGGYGTGGIAKAGTGTLVLGSSGTLTSLALSSGSLRIAEGAAVTTTASQLSTSANTLLEISGTLRSTLTGTGWTAPSGNVTVGANGVVIQQGNSAVTNFLFDNKVTWSPGSTFVFRDYTGGPAVSGRNYAMNVVFDSSGSPVNVGSIAGSGTWTIQGDFTIGENVNFQFGNFIGTLDYEKSVIVGGTLGTTANAARSFTINSGRELLMQNAGTLNIASDQTVTISGSVRSTASAAQTSTISGGTLSLGNGNRTFDVAAGTGNAGLSISSVITNGSLTKTGAGTLQLTSINTFTGPTTIDAGRLEFGADASLASAAILVNSQAVLDVRAKAAEGLSLASGQTLKGTGTIDGNLMVANGGVLAPGASVGTITQSGTTAFGPNGSFQFEINNATGTAGGGETFSGWDLLETGALVINATEANKFTINIVSLTTGDPQDQVPGATSNFNPAQPYEWRFVTASEEITTFNASVFSINTTHFLPSDWVAPGRGFSVGPATGSTTALAIYYTPEPDAWLLAGLGLAAAGWAGRRRKTCGSGTP